MKPVQELVDPQRRRILLALAGFCAIPAYAASAQATPPRSFNLRIERRRLAAGAATLRVTKGETVELNWSSDETAAIHLHGYNLEAHLEPGKTVVMKFEAYATGRFPLVAHGYGAETTGRSKDKAHKETALLYLEVHPR